MFITFFLFLYEKQYLMGNFIALINKILDTKKKNQLKDLIDN